MHNYLTAWMASTALFVVCAELRAQPAAAPTPPAAPAQPTTPDPSAAEPASPIPASEASPGAAGSGTPGGAASAEAQVAPPAPVAPTPTSPRAQSDLAVPAAPDEAAAAPAQANRPVFVPSTPWPAPAEFPFAVYLNIEPQWNSDAGYDLFDDDDVGTEVGLGISYDAVELVPDVALVAELAWGMTSQEQGQLFGGAFSSTDFQLYRLNAAVGAHYRVLPWVGPHARIAGGLSLLDTSFEGSLTDERFEDSAVSPFVRFGAGVSAEQSLGTRIAAGLLFEGGYTLATGAALKLEPRSDSDGIETDYAELGTLSLSGPYLRIAALLRF